MKYATGEPGMMRIGPHSGKDALLVRAGAGHSNRQRIERGERDWNLDCTHVCSIGVRGGSDCPRPAIAFRYAGLSLWCAHPDDRIGMGQRMAALATATGAGTCVATGRNESVDFHRILTHRFHLNLTHPETA